MADETTPSADDELDETELQDATDGAEERPDREAMPVIGKPADSLTPPPIAE